MWPGGNPRPPLPAGDRLRILVEASHVTRRIIGPALAADIGVEMRVAVGDNIEAGHFLLVEIHGDCIDILLAELVVHHRVEEAARAEILRVPARPRQRAGDRGRQHDVFGSAKHVRHLPGVAFSLAASLCPRRAAWKPSSSFHCIRHGQNGHRCPLMMGSFHAVPKCLL